MSAATKAWSITGGVLFAASVAAYGVNAITLLGHEIYDDEATYSAAEVQSIDIHNDDGAVTVIGTDAASASGVIHLTAKISSGIRRTENTHRVVDGVLEVRSSCPSFGSSWCSVEYTLEVPRELATSVHSDNGSVHITDLSGAVHVSADNGSVRLVGASGPVEISDDNGRVVAEQLSSPTVRISSSNGSIRATFVAPPTVVDLSSDNGSVTVELPRVESGYNVDASSDNGSLHVDVLDNPDSDRTVEADSSNGSVRIQYTG